ncbi:unnamed protein product [Lampetra planeri]
MSTGMAHPAEYPGQTPVECINVFDELSGKLGLTVEEIKDLVSDEDNLKDLCNLVEKNGMFSNEGSNTEKVEAEGAHYELPLGTTEEGNNEDLSSDKKLSKNKFLKFKMKYQHHLKNICPRMGIKETKRLVNVKWHSMCLAEKQLYINRCHHRELTEQGNDDSSLKYSTRPSFPKKTDGMAEQPWEDDCVVPENRRDEKSPSSSVQCKLESGSTSGVGAQE